MYTSSISLCQRKDGEKKEKQLNEFKCNTKMKNSGVLCIVGALPEERL